jgi:hypothetical protein
VQGQGFCLVRLKKIEKERHKVPRNLEPHLDQILKKPLGNEVVEGLVAWKLEVLVGQNVSNVRADGKTSNDIESSCF